jgi:hypothetical protein
MRLLFDYITKAADLHYIALLQERQVYKGDLSTSKQTIMEVASEVEFAHILKHLDTKDIHTVSIAFGGYWGCSAFCLVF